MRLPHGRRFAVGNLFEEKLMTHDYPECGPGSIDVEELYQVFRERFAKELTEKLQELDNDD